MTVVQAKQEAAAFRKQLKESFKLLTRDEAGKVIKAVALNLFRELVEGTRTADDSTSSGVAAGTPVDTGRARLNWQVAIGFVPNSVRPGVENPKASKPEARDAREAGIAAEASRRAIAEAQSVLAALATDPFKLIVITNNLPYIERLEDGHSKQAPQGWIAPAIERARIAVSPA